MGNSFGILQKNLKLLQGRRTNQEMAMIIGSYSPKTWAGRVECPGKMTIQELSALAREYKISVAELISVDLITRR